MFVQEGNLKRYPTPYPDELKNMVKTAQSVAHRLKEDESSDESGKDPKPIERNHIGVQDVGVKVHFIRKETSLSVPVCFCSTRFSSSLITYSFYIKVEGYF